MDFGRRQFLLGTAAGLVLPRYFDKVFSYVENYGEPLLELPRQPVETMYAVSERGTGYELNLGDPWEEPPQMSIREFARYRAGDDWERWYREDWCVDPDEPVDWDAEIHYDYVLDHYIRHDAPTALAYRYLENLDLGPQLQGATAVGEIRFIDGACPGNDYLGVDAIDDVSLSLLQNRLNELRTGIEIVVC